MQAIALCVCVCVCVFLILCLSLGCTYCIDGNLNACRSVSETSKKRLKRSRWMKLSYCKMVDHSPCSYEVSPCEIYAMIYFVLCHLCLIEKLL